MAMGRRHFPHPKSRTAISTSPPGRWAILHDENCCFSKIYEAALLFLRCYSEKSAAKMLMFQRLGGNEGPVSIFPLLFAAVIAAVPAQGAPKPVSAAHGQPRPACLFSRFTTPEWP